MQLKQSQINDFIDISIEDGFNATDFDIEVGQPTIFQYRNSKYFFKFFDSKVSSYGYRDPIRPSFEAVFSPGINELEHVEEVYDSNGFKKVFKKWLTLLKEELKAEERWQKEFLKGFKVNMPSEEMKKAWTDEDQENAAKYLNEVEKALPSIGATTKLIAEFKKQSEEILEEIKLINKNSNKIITKEFVVREIIGYLIVLAIGHFGEMGYSFVQGFMNIIFSNNNFFKSIPPQSIIT